MLITHDWLLEVFLLSGKLFPLLRVILVAPRHTLFCNDDIAVPFFLNDLTLGKDLGFTL
jgi:hypothetical protein